MQKTITDRSRRVKEILDGCVPETRFSSTTTRGQKAQPRYLNWTLHSGVNPRLAVEEERAQRLEKYVAYRSSQGSSSANGIDRKKTTVAPHRDVESRYRDLRVADDNPRRRVESAVERFHSTLMVNRHRMHAISDSRTLSLTPPRVHSAPTSASGSADRSEEAGESPPSGGGEALSDSRWPKAKKMVRIRFPLETGGDEEITVSERSATKEVIRPPEGRRERREGEGSLDMVQASHRKDSPRSKTTVVVFDVSE